MLPGFRSLRWPGAYVGPIMDLSLAGIWARVRGKALRYVAVSLSMTVLTQILLWLFAHHLEWGFALSNVTAVTLVAIPAFMLNRSFVWKSDGVVSLRDEVLPFWSLTIAGLALSTVFAAVADGLTDRALAVNVANIAGFGVLWVAKFMVLDEYLFNPERPDRPGR